MTNITASPFTCDITPPGELIIRQARAAKAKADALAADADIKVLATRLTCDITPPGFHNNPEHIEYLAAKARLAAIA